jgi:hypothetical protein
LLLRRSDFAALHAPTVYVPDAAARRTRVTQDRFAPQV